MLKNFEKFLIETAVSISNVLPIKIPTFFLGNG